MSLFYFSIGALVIFVVGVVAIGDKGVIIIKIEVEFKYP